MATAEHRPRPVGWNPSIGWWPLIEARAAASPDHPMLIDERGRSHSFESFRLEAERVAAGLVERGVRRDQVVSWQLPTSMEAVVLLAALGRLGARQNPIIPILRRAEVSIIVGQLQTDWFVTPGVWRGFDHHGLAADVTAGLPCGIIDCVIGEGLPTGDPAALEPYRPADDVRWYFYTSGTTAEPKGARHTDASAISSSNIAVRDWGLVADSVFPVAIPLTHIGGIMLIAAQMRIGFTIGIIEAFDPAASPLAMAEMGATHLGSAVPFFLAYLEAQRRHGSEPLFPNLRTCIAGGAPLPPELHGQIQERLGGRGILNAWGMTECPSPVSITIDDPDPVILTGSVGRAGPGVELRVVDDELRIKAPQLFAGYVDEHLDEAAFDEAGFFRTGDLGSIDAHGYVTITGRNKDIIIRNAENISAVEVENVLHQHPSIADVAVVGLPDARTGERACAVVVLAEGAEPLTLAELAAHCADHGLARQKTPEQLEVVDSLPRNSMGKLLKHEVRRALTA
jgi:acyl-CoA synthetase (AMP-forming)/AMP-acid ligase II